MKKIIVIFSLIFLALIPFSSAFANKGEFVIANYAEPESLDPHLTGGIPEWWISMALFEGLTAYDAKTGTHKPGLAESWKVSKDGHTYTFKLRKTTWSDGVPITAHTVVGSWIRELNPKTGGPYTWFPAMFLKGGSEYNSGKTGPEGVKIKAVDDYTFQMTTISPAPYVLDAIAHNSFAIVPLHAIKKHGRNWILPENFVGNGPFILEKWEPQARITVVPNPRYWDKKNVHLERVVYLPITGESLQYTMYKNGELDWVTMPPLDQIEEIMLLDDYIVGPALQTEFYFVQTTKPPFSDPRVRQAFSMAINRKDLVEKVRGGGETATGAVVPPMFGYNPIKGNTYNPTRARKLMAEAGFPGGKGFPRSHLLYNTNEMYKKISEYVQQQWEETLGVKVDLKNQEWKTYLNSKNHGDYFGIARGGWVGDYPDSNTFLELFITNGGMNGGKFSNAEFDKLVLKAAKMKPGKTRSALLRKAETILVTEQQAVIPIYHNVHQNIVRISKFGGWHHNIMNAHPVKDIYLK